MRAGVSFGPTCNVDPLKSPLPGNETVETGFTICLRWWNFVVEIDAIECNSLIVI
jgi:hypothetical protein